MHTLAELEKELQQKRQLRGWYGMRRDYAMENRLRDECYALFIEIEYRKRA
jgi:hypothetical protein